jgi:hypothetical protein
LVEFSFSEFLLLHLGLFLHRDWHFEAVARVLLGELIGEGRVGLDGRAAFLILFPGHRSPHEGVVIFSITLHLGNLRAAMMAIGSVNLGLHSLRLLPGFGLLLYCPGGGLLVGDSQGEAVGGSIEALQHRLLSESLLLVQVVIGTAHILGQSRDLGGSGLALGVLMDLGELLMGCFQWALLKKFQLFRI